MSPCIYGTIVIACWLQMNDRYGSCSAWCKQSSSRAATLQTPANRNTCNCDRQGQTERAERAQRQALVQEILAIRQARRAKQAEAQAKPS